jgi:hypothetical protein
MVWKYSSVHVGAKSGGGICSRHHGWKSIWARTRMAFLISLLFDRRVSGGPRTWDWSCHFLIKVVVIEFGNISILFHRGIRSNLSTRIRKCGDWRRIRAKRRSRTVGRESKVCSGLVVEPRRVSEPPTRSTSMGDVVGIERRVSVVIHPDDIPGRRRGSISGHLSNL